MKNCQRCKEHKLFTEFASMRDSEDGYAKWCKSCKSLYDKERYPLLKAQIIARQATVHSKFLKYQREARARNHSWNLSYDQFVSLWQQPCVYCGKDISTIGIDRVDSNVGYEIKNCVACCGTCNLMKFTLPKDEWIAHMKRILDHLGML